VPTTCTLTVPDWTPARLNQFLGKHWSAGHRLKKADRQTLGLYAATSGIPKASCRRRVSVTFTLQPRARRFDPDAPLKSLLDALVACGMLVDDGPKWCELGGIAFRRGKDRATEIRLEDLVADNR
jgi:hypothetical protein